MHETPTDTNTQHLHLAKKLDAEIFLYKNVLDDPKKFISLLEKLDTVAETYPALRPWESWLASDDDGFSYGARKIFSLRDLDKIPEEYKNDVKYLIDQIANGLHGVARLFIQDRGLSSDLAIDSFSGVMKYSPGASMGAHFDAQGGDETLTYSIVLYINDDYEGGEISFTVRDYDLRDPEFSSLKANEDLKTAIAAKSVDYWYKPEAGAALVFPSTHPYNHQVHLVRSGSRYMSPGYILQRTVNRQYPS
jgi:hypothetical protein